MAIQDLVHVKKFNSGTGLLYTPPEWATVLLVEAVAAGGGGCGNGYENGQPVWHYGQKGGDTIIEVGGVQFILYGGGPGGMIGDQGAGGTSTSNWNLVGNLGFAIPGGSGSGMWGNNIAGGQGGVGPWGGIAGSGYQMDGMPAVNHTGAGGAGAGASGVVPGGCGGGAGGYGRRWLDATELTITVGSGGAGGDAGPGGYAGGVGGHGRVVITAFRFPVPL